MKVKLSDHFTYSKLLKFVLPSVAMMIVTSIYGVVDGLFIANFSSKTAYAAVNFIFPAIMILSTPGFMLGTGGGALVSKALGENEPERANRLFSLFVYAGMAAGLFFGTLAFILMPSIATLFGAGGDLLSEAVTYGRIVVVGCIPQTMHFVFQSLSSTAEKPEIEFRVTLAAGCTNVVFDALFVGVFKWGAAGAAVATVLAQCVSGFTPFIYFIRPNTSLLRLSRPYWDGRAMLKACTNGSSELMSNISMSLVSMLYNVQLLKYLGEDGVAAYGTVMYVNFILISAFIGYSIGTSSLVGYNFGAKNKKELKNLLKKSLLILALTGAAMTLLAYFCAYPLSYPFSHNDRELLDLTVHGFKIMSFTFFLSGFAIFLSSFFTALSDGLSSAIISFLRTIVFELLLVLFLFLPVLVGPDGIWYAGLLAEFLGTTLAFGFLIGKRKRFGYFDK